MKLRLALAATVALALSLGVSSAGAVPFAALNPGENASYAEEVGVQFVFVGYTEQQVDVDEFFEELPGFVRARGSLAALLRYRCSARHYLRLRVQGPVHGRRLGGRLLRLPGQHRGGGGGASTGRSALFKISTTTSRTTSWTSGRTGSSTRRASSGCSTTRPTASTRAGRPSSTSTGSDATTSSSTRT